MAEQPVDFRDKTTLEQAINFRAFQVCSELYQNITVIKGLKKHLTDMPESL